MDAAGRDKLASSEAVLETVDLRLPSSLETVDQIEQAMDGLARRAGFEEDDACNIAMAIREAAINASKHGNGFKADKSVGVQLQRTPRAIIARIADQGPGMDPAAIPDPLDPANLLRASGRGVFLMRAIMDEVHFRQLEPGTEVTLIKYRNTETRG